MATWLPLPFSLTTQAGSKQSPLNHLSSQPAGPPVSGPPQHCVCPACHSDTARAEDSSTCPGTVPEGQCFCMEVQGDRAGTSSEDSPCHSYFPPSTAIRVGHLLMGLSPTPAGAAELSKDRQEPCLGPHSAALLWAPPSGLWLEPSLPNSPCHSAPHFPA